MAVPRAGIAVHIGGVVASRRGWDLVGDAGVVFGSNQRTDERHQQGPVVRSLWGNCSREGGFKGRRPP